MTLPSGTEPLAEPIITYGQLYNFETYYSEIESEIYFISFKKMHLPPVATAKLLFFF